MSVRRCTYFAKRTTENGSDGATHVSVHMILTCKANMVSPFLIFSASLIISPSKCSNRFFNSISSRIQTYQITVYFHFSPWSLLSGAHTPLLRSGPASVDQPLPACSRHWATESKGVCSHHHLSREWEPGRHAQDPFQAQLALPGRSEGRSSCVCGQRRGFRRRWGQRLRAYHLSSIYLNPHIPKVMILVHPKFTTTKLWVLVFYYIFYLLSYFLQSDCRNVTKIDTCYIWGRRFPIIINRSFLGPGQWRQCFCSKMYTKTFTSLAIK